MAWRFYALKGELELHALFVSIYITCKGALQMEKSRIVLGWKIYVNMLSYILPSLVG